MSDFPKTAVKWETRRFENHETLRMNDAAETVTIPQGGLYSVGLRDGRIVELTLIEPEDRTKPSR